MSRERLNDMTTARPIILYLSVALVEVTRLAVSEGYYVRVQAIMVSIDQRAEGALGNREYFLHRSYCCG
jgi:hypothetical protein